MRNERAPIVVSSKIFCRTGKNHYLCSVTSFNPKTKNMSKRYPSPELYRMIHSFLNSSVQSSNNNEGYRSEDILTGIGCTKTSYMKDHKKRYTVTLPNGDFQDGTSFNNRFNEIIKDMDRRLKAHCYQWSVIASGKTKDRRYRYKEFVTEDLPAECEAESRRANFNIFTEVVGRTQYPLAPDAEKKEIISFSSNSFLNNIGLVKDLFMAAKKNRVVEFVYQPANGNPKKEVLMSPQYLKEYNMRWFVFGQVESGENAGTIQNFRVDLIDTDRPKPVADRTDMEYHDAPKDYYKDYFKDIIGVTHYEGSVPVDIEIQTLNRYTHIRLVTKPLHPSQKVVRDFGVEKDKDGKDLPGLIKLRVCVNNELKTALLAFGRNIKVRWNGRGYESFVQDIRAMRDLYEE